MILISHLNLFYSSIRSSPVFINMDIFRPHSHHGRYIRHGDPGRSAGSSTGRGGGQNQSHHQLSPTGPTLSPLNCSLLMIICLFQSMIDTELYSMFITLGPIVSAKIMRDKNSGYSFGYGFVQYENPADAAKAIQQLNGLQVANNKRIKVWRTKLEREPLFTSSLVAGILQPPQHGGHQGHQPLCWERSPGHNRG